MVLQELKIKLLERCRLLIEQKLDEQKAELDKIQAAANEETKSSAGDKYETGRAMLMQEKEKLAGQQAQSANQLKALNNIDPNKVFECIEAGAMVGTDKGIYLIGLGLGIVEMDKQKFFVISGAAPVAQALIGKRTGDEVLFNKQKIKILELT